MKRSATRLSEKTTSCFPVDAIITRRTDHSTTAAPIWLTFTPVHLLLRSWSSLYPGVKDVDAVPLVQTSALVCTEAVDQFVSSGSVVGIGCGATVDHCVQLISERLASGALRDVTAMATSEATERRLREFGIPLLPPDSDKAVDVALTGCDGVSSSKDVVKGGKGAMLREKLVRAA